MVVERDEGPMLRLGQMHTQVRGTLRSREPCVLRCREAERTDKESRTKGIR